MQSKAGLEVGSAFSTGSYFLAEATTAGGAALEETDITGTAGMHTDYSGSIGVHDSLSLDLQDSDTTTGEYDYLSLGWSSAGHASRGLHFAYDLSLDDADLPTETDGSDSTPYTPDSPPPTTTAPSGGATGSAPTSLSSVTDMAGFGGSSSSGSTDGGTSGGSTSTPTPGKPVAELDSLSTTGGSSKVWVQEKVNRQTFSLNPSSNPSVLPIVHTVKKALSVRIGGSSDLTLTTKLVNWVPTGTVTAKGGMNVAFMDASIDTVDYGFDADVPPGYTNTISEKQFMSKDLKTHSAGIEFNLVLTLSVTAAPTMTGTVTINVGYEELAMLSSFKHEQFVHNSTGGIYETWLLQQSIHRYWTTTTGGVGGTVNGLHTESFTQNYSTTIDTATGTPPPPPPPTQTSIDTALDYLQTGLDVAGMIPILGEGADALNAGIHLGRGNYGEAALSLAAMVPLAGAGVTAAKFANRITKAAVNNVDKLDEVAAAAKKMAEVRKAGLAGELAAGIVDAKKGVLGPISGKMRFPDELNKTVLKQGQRALWEGWVTGWRD